MILYGIKNCDTIKKARRFLEQAGVEYQFHDYRQDGLDQILLAQLAAKLGWQQLLNPRGTTWRALSEADKADLNEQKALGLMLAHPALIKRPVLIHAEHALLGFSEQSYQSLIDES
jgi:arsenate reductase